MDVSLDVKEVDHTWEMQHKSNYGVLGTMCVEQCSMCGIRKLVHLPVKQDDFHVTISCSAMPMPQCRTAELPLPKSDNGVWVLMEWADNGTKKQRTFKEVVPESLQGSNKAGRFDLISEVVEICHYKF